MKASRLLVCSLVGLVAGLGGETLLLLQRQARVIEAGLREDFRVLLFLASDVGEAKQRVIEERLRSLPDVSDVRLVSRQEQLGALKRDDPELAEAVPLIGDNPLLPAFEVRLAEAAVVRVSQWIVKATALADFSDARYKPAQVQAILQAQFYARFLDVALAMLVCAGCALALAGVWPGRRLALGARQREAALAAAGSVGGAACGALLVCLMARPLRALALWWEWPALGAQLALLAGAAAAGWALCARSG